MIKRYLISSWIFIHFICTFELVCAVCFPICLPPTSLFVCVVVETLMGWCTYRTVCSTQCCRSILISIVFPSVTPDYRFLGIAWHIIDWRIIKKYNTKLCDGKTSSISNYTLLRRSPHITFIRYFQQNIRTQTHFISCGIRCIIRIYNDTPTITKQL